MPLARFLQHSDVHLGATIGWLPADRRETRRREQHRALEQGVAHAIERGVDALLIPGDLFDRDGVSAEILAFAVHVFEAPGCPPVFIAPGNHDPYSATSATWEERLLRGRGWAWPDHVHVFRTAAWSMKSIPGRPIDVWGRCFTSHVLSTDRPLAESALSAVTGAAAGSAPASAEPGRVRVALFHGSREGFCPPGQKMAGPFSDAEARATPFAYIAVGHYHAPSRFEDESDESCATGVRLAYAGSTVALDVTETGAHGALEVRIEAGPRRPVVSTEPIALDPRRVHDLSIDVSGVSSADQIDRRVLQALDTNQVSDQDIVTLRLTGRLVRGVRYSGLGSDLRARVFHSRIDTKGVRPDYDLASYRTGEAATTEERFARALLEKLDVERDPDERAIIESALYYGLDAFKLREVTPAYEELGE